MSRPASKKRASVENFYERVPKPVDKKKVNPNFDVHGIDVPFRMLIVGASGSMKTNTAMDIFQKFSGTFDEITVVCRNKDEPLYNLLADTVSDDQLTMIEIEGDDLSSIPTLSGQNSQSPHKLVIFDDLCLVKNQKVIEEFFIRSRKLNISCMYLTQSYYASPKNIRINCQYVILKKIDSQRDLRTLLSEYSLNIELDQLVSLYTECTVEKLDWLMIAMEHAPNDRFYLNYDPIDPDGGSREHKSSEPDSSDKKPSDTDKKPERHNVDATDDIPPPMIGHLTDQQKLELLKKYALDSD